MSCCSICRNESSHATANNLVTQQGIAGSRCLARSLYYHLRAGCARSAPRVEFRTAALVSSILPGLVDHVSSVTNHRRWHSRFATATIDLAFAIIYLLNESPFAWRDKTKALLSTDSNVGRIHPSEGGKDLVGKDGRWNR